MTRVFKARDGRRWMAEITARGGEGWGQPEKTTTESLTPTYLAFEALDGSDCRKVLTVPEYLSSLAKVSEDRLCAWLDQAKKTK
jgi:hypothetical protein